MRILTAALIIACTTSAEAQLTRGWYLRAINAREAALTAQADAEVMASEAVFELGVLQDRVARLRSGNVLSQANLDHIDLAGEYVAQWELQAAIQLADRAWTVAESDWLRIWTASDRQPEKVIRQFNAAELLYGDALTQALDALASIEAKNHWLDDHLDRLEEMGWK